jgi:hypothetical protein
MKKKNGWVIEIAEVKSSVTGVLALERGQQKRIISAGKFLSAIFGAPTKLIVPTS